MQHIDIPLTELGSIDYSKIPDFSPPTQTRACENPDDNNFRFPGILLETCDDDEFINIDELRKWIRYEGSKCNSAAEFFLKLNIAFGCSEDRLAFATANAAIDLISELDNNPILIADIIENSTVFDWATQDSNPQSFYRFFKNLQYAYGRVGTPEGIFVIMTTFVKKIQRSAV